MSPDASWRPSRRALRYWAAIVVVVIGVICGATIPGTLGGTICTAIVGVGLIAIVSMVFYDVGLTEDRDRERERRRLDPDDGAPPSSAPPSGAPPSGAPPSTNGAPPHEKTAGRLGPDWLKERRRRSH
jgi:hypothetical protein